MEGEEGEGSCVGKGEAMEREWAGDVGTLASFCSGPKDDVWEAVLESALPEAPEMHGFSPASVLILPPMTS